MVPVILKDFSYFHFTFTVELLHNYHFTSHSFWVSVYSCSYSFPSKYLPISFAVYLKTEDGWCSEKKKKKTQRQIFVRHDLFTRGSMTAYINSFTTPITNSTEGKRKCFLFWFFYKRNGKRCTGATIELWIHLGGLLSTQEDRVALGNSYDSFMLSNLPRAWLHAARLPFTFTSCISDTSKLTISVIAPSVSSHLYFIFKVTEIRDTLGRQEIAVTPVYKRLYGQMRSWEKNINGKNNNNKCEENRKWHCISTIVSWKCFGYCWSIYLN